MSIQPLYCRLSLRFMRVGEVVHGFLLRGLGQGDSAGRLCLNDELKNDAEALSGDGAGAFTIYALYTCHLWEGLELGKCDFVSQSSACGSLLGVSYCSLSCVVSCTRDGLIRPTCLFHGSQVPVPLILVLWVSRLQVKMDLYLICLPSVDFHREV